MQLIVVDNELEYNESMIVQREEEIREIESGITELNEIFRDLGTMVHEQGSMLGKLSFFFYLSRLGGINWMIKDRHCAKYSGSD